MTQEEKIVSIENWCKHYDSNSAFSYCAGCPIDEICTKIGGDFDDEHLTEVELAYNIIHADENHEPELDEAHERFMNIGDDRNATTETIEEIMRKVKYAPVEIMINDTVSHPNHYCKGGIECIQAIKASMTKEAFAGYCKGNVIKYVFRYEQKGGKESLEKASVYLKWLIEEAGG